MRLHAISALCCELDRQGPSAGIDILTSMNEKSMPTLEVIRILALVCTAGTKDIVISGACAVLSRLLPHSTIAAINEKQHQAERKTEVAEGGIVRLKMHVKVRR